MCKALGLAKPQTWQTMWLIFTSSHISDSPATSPAAHLCRQSNHETVRGKSRFAEEFIWFDLKTQEINWLIGKKSHLSIENKLPI
jgi:hypothetical protein